MLCITSESDDPFYNIAVEEVLLGNSNEDYLILYVNSPSVIVGKHQTAHREVNTKFVFENRIPVIRRISGGGTVYHDEGNLNYTFIMQSEPGKQVDFKKYTMPVVEFLQFLGINAVFEGKNDIRVDGLKISGNAEHIHRERVLHHGTLLFDVSLERLGNSIRKDTSCYSGRSVDSNPSSVTNLKERLLNSFDIDEFRNEMINYFRKINPSMILSLLTQEDKKEAEQLVRTKFSTWEWNYAYGPEYIFENSFIMQGAEHKCHLSVKDGIINECEITGSQKVSGRGKWLIGYRHMPDDVLTAFKKEGISIHISDIFNFF